MIQTRRIRTAIRVLILLGLCAAPLFALPEKEGTASGKFTTRKRSFDVGGAYAFWARTGDDRLIEVAVSNSSFVAKAFDAFYDPKPVIADRFADAETFVAYFEFEPDGKYHGLSFYFGSGDGCGFCYSSTVKSTVKIAGGRLRGRLTSPQEEGQNQRFDVELDVPVASSEWGKPVPTGGGEIGAALRAWNAAWDKDDRKALFDLMDATLRERWTKREKDGKLEPWIEYRKKVHSNVQDAHVSGGYVRGDQAVLLVRAKNTYIDHLKGQVALGKENGRWKVADEIYEVGE